MSRCRYVQENRKMRFEEAYQGWTGGRLTQPKGRCCWGVSGCQEPRLFAAKPERGSCAGMVAAVTG